MSDGKEAFAQKPQEQPQQLEQQVKNELNSYFTEDLNRYVRKTRGPTPFGELAAEQKSKPSVSVEFVEGSPSSIILNVSGLDPEELKGFEGYLSKKGFNATVEDENRIRIDNYKETLQKIEEARESLKKKMPEFFAALEKISKKI